MHLPSNVLIPSPEPSATRRVRLSIAFDQSRLPLIRVKLEGVISNDDFAAYLAESDLIVAAGRRYGLVYDLTQPFQLSPRLRKLQADWIDRNKVALAKLCVGAAFAIDSAAARGVLTAVLWLARLPFEYTIVKSMHDAQIWTADRLRNASPFPK